MAFDLSTAAPVTETTGRASSGFDLATASPIGEQPSKEQEKPATLMQKAEDIGISGLRGAVSGTKSITDVLGSGNVASQKLQQLDDLLASYASAASKKDDAEQARIIEAAKGQGLWEEFKAQAKALAVAPVRTTAGVIGSAVPFIAGSLAAGALAPEAAVGAGAAEVASALATRKALETGTEVALGAATGVGMEKEKIYSGVKQALLDKGIDEDTAEKTAQDAQSYGGKNLDQIITSGIVGGGAMAFNPAAKFAKGVASKVLGSVAETTEEEGAGLLARTAKGAVTGGGAMAAQSAQQQVGENVALQREGVETPAMQNVLQEALGAGVPAAIFGGAMEGISGKRPSEAIHKDFEAEDKKLLNAIDLYNKDNAPKEEAPVQGPQLLLEDKSGTYNKLFQFAEDNRDKVPALGVILDSNAPRDVKLDMLMGRLGEVNFNPDTPIEMKGRVALPAPEAGGTVAAGQAFNNALDSNADLTDLSVRQGPNGFQIANGEGHLLAGSIRSERDALVAMEALRREHDFRQTKEYQANSEQYNKERRDVMTAADLKASRESTSPFYPVSLKDVSDIAPELMQPIQIGRMREGVSDLNAPITFDELKQRGADKATLDELAYQQKPVTRGTGVITDEHINEVLGPRPEKPTDTARTPEELAKLDVSPVTFRDEEAIPKGEVAPNPEDPKTAEPKPIDPAEVAAAKAHIADRISQVSSQGKQGEEIGKAVQTALDSGNFTPQQMLAAFKMADISARLLGKTTADPHVFEFANKIVTPDGSQARGVRYAPTESNLKGLLQLALDPNTMRRNYGASTAAHEAFHVLQDLFANHDKGAARIINDAFRGAKYFDDISPTLLNKLKLIKDKATGKSVYQNLKNDVSKSVFDGLSQPVRERELQAYVFGNLDDTASRGTPMTGLGAAYTRFMNYFSNFKERAGNMLRGDGYRSVDDLYSKTMAGEAQAGLGKEGILSRKILPGQEDISESVPAPKQITPTTPEQVEKEINSTGQRPEAEVNNNRYTKVWDSVREFFYPFALVRHLDDLLQLRNVTTGSVTSAEKYARRISDTIAGASKEDSEATYKYLTTRNADDKTIENLDVRKAAIEAKKAINDTAKKLIERKMMTKESFDAHYDQYLPRLYLYHLASEGGLKTPLGGRSAMEYLKARNEELSQEERDVLGEIKDPAFLTYVAMSRPARDMAVTDYLNNIMIYGSEGDRRWVPPNTMVEWKTPNITEEAFTHGTREVPKEKLNTHKMTPYAMLRNADMLEKYVLPVAKITDPAQYAIMKANADNMRATANAALAALTPKVENFKSEGYRQMPDQARYGNMAGAIVHKAIYDDLVGTFIPAGKENRSMLDRIFGNENSKLNDLTNIWKLGKTTLNPPTQVKNFFSNAISLHLIGGVSPIKFPDLMKRSFKEIAHEGPMWKEAESFGLSGGTMMSAEMRKAFDRYSTAHGKLENDGSILSMFSHAGAAARSFGRTFSEKASNLYQASEVLYKMMLYLNTRDEQKKTMTPDRYNSDGAKSAAVNLAHDTLFDYSLVNKNIRWLRNSPIGLPFITYYYKMLPKLIETARKHPLRYAPYVALAYGIPAATMSNFNLTSDEMEKLRLSAMDYIRDKGSLFFLPMRDSKGNIEFMDMGGIFPYAAFTDPIIEAIKGQPVKGIKDLGQTINPSGPLVTALTVLNSGVDPFTNRPIMDPRDAPKEQALSLFSYIWNQALPPIVNVDLNNMDHSGGAVPRLYNSLFTDGTGVDKKGLPKPEALESAARLLGFNITPLAADRQRAMNIMITQNQIRQSESFRSQLMKDQSMTPDTKKARIADLNDKIKDAYKELAQYAQDTSGVDEIMKKIRSQ